MHELGITQEIVAIAADTAGDRHVTKVTVEIGRLTAVLPEAVRFCFGLCAEGTVVEGAVLEIVETPGRGRCRACGREQTLEQAYGLCNCGTSDFDWIAGDELRVRTVEVQ